MDRAGPAHGLGAEGHVGGLGGHADHRPEMQEIPIVGGVVAGEQQPSAPRLAVLAFAVELVGVVQGEDHLHEHPGGQHRREHQGHAQALDEAMLGLGDRQLRGDGEEADEGRRHRQDQDEVLALVHARGAAADEGLVAFAHHLQGGPDEDGQHRIPGEHRARALAQRIGDQGQGQGDRAAAQDRGREVLAPREDPPKLADHPSLPMPMASLIAKQQKGDP